MLTQRDADIAQVEAKLKTDKLFQEWYKSYLGKRAKHGTDEGYGRVRDIAGVAEDSTTPAAEYYPQEDNGVLQSAQD